MLPRVRSAAAARRLPDNLLTSQAEPRLLSGAVRHSLYLGEEEEEEEGQGREREDTERSPGGMDGRKERKSGRCHSERRESGSEPRQNYSRRVQSSDGGTRGSGGGVGGGVDR